MQHQLVLTPGQVLAKGFKAYNGLPNDNDGEMTDKNVNLFKKIHGSNPTVIALMWHDIISNGGAHVHTEKDFKRHLTVMCFLWAHPKNAEILALAFGVSTRQAQGENLWQWVWMIATQKEHKIIWPTKEFENPNSQKFLASVDGVDFKVWEGKHPTLPCDRRNMSHKFKKAAVKYGIAVDIHRSRVVWLSEPYRGGVHDKTIHIEGLSAKVPEGKLVIANSVCGRENATPADHKKMALPSSIDKGELHNFKARVRSRHETFNGRIRDFSVLSNTFRHKQDKHKHAFEAVCVTIQYQMENGNPLFDA